MKSLALLWLVALTGCATIHEHPYATGIAIALVAGSLVACTMHDNRTSAPTHDVNRPICGAGAC